MSRSRGPAYLYQGPASKGFYRALHGPAHAGVRMVDELHQGFNRARRSEPFKRPRGGGLYRRLVLYEFFYQNALDVVLPELSEEQHRVVPYPDVPVPERRYKGVLYLLAAPAAKSLQDREFHIVALVGQAHDYLVYRVRYAKPGHGLVRGLPHVRAGVLRGLLEEIEGILVSDEPEPPRPHLAQVRVGVLEEEREALPHGLRRNERETVRHLLHPAPVRLPSDRVH